MRAENHSMGTFVLSGIAVILLSHYEAQSATFTTSGPNERVIRGSNPTKVRSSVRLPARKPVRPVSIHIPQVKPCLKTGTVTQAAQEMSSVLANVSGEWAMARSPSSLADSSTKRAIENVKWVGKASGAEWIQMLDQAL